jgi:hypothetical protein
VLGSEIRAGTDISVNPGTYTTEDGDIRKYRIIQVDNVATNANPVILQSAGSNNYNIAATAGKYIVAQELFFNALDAITGTYPAGSIGPVLGLAARRTAAQWLTAYSPNFINLGQALDAYRLDYDQVITQQLIQLIATSGVTGVVIPVRASVYASADAAAVVPESLFTRVTEVIGWCRAAGLGMIITPLHHYARFAGDVENSTYNDPLETAVDPAIHKTRAKNIVKQFITRYETDAQDDIAWQALNEPNSMDSALLNSFLSELVAETINLSNRPLFISPLAQSKATELNKLRPVLQTLAGNTKIALNLHHYSPAFWALQAAPSGWVSGQPIPAAPIQWSNSYLAGIYQVMKTAKWEIDEYNFPTILGEYGASIFAGTDAQRMVGIRAQKQAAAFYNIPAAAWMFGSDFAVMDRVNNVWSWKPDALSAIKDVTQTLGQGPANMIAFTAADIQAARKSVAAGRTAG